MYMDDNNGFFGNVRSGFQHLVSLVRGENMEKPKNLSKVETMVVVPNPETNLMKPTARSGHRVFVDQDFLYVVGGFSKSENEQNILREVWRYNFFTQIWEKMDVHTTTFPTALASFSMAQTMTDRAQAMIFGGTAVPFGQSSSNDIHVLTIDDRGVESVKLDVFGEKLGTYGQAMRRSSVDPETYYIVGGTTGSDFYLDVHELKKENRKWIWKRLNESDFQPEGLYRLEIVHLDDDLLFFGGGTPQHVRSFATITVFNLKTRKYTFVDTHADDVHGWPASRRCHSIVQWGRRVYMSGGCADDVRNDAHGNAFFRGVSLFDDIWSFDLDTYKWSLYPYRLQNPVFFHDAAITAEGQMLVWGGVTDSLSHVRTDEGQSVWLCPPSLKMFALMAVRDRYKFLLSSDITKYRVTRPLDIIQRVLCNYTIIDERGDSAVPA